VAESFFDSNVILYLVSAEPEKATRAEDLLSDGGVISVQVLNEFVSVARRKYSIDWARILDVTSAVRTVCRVEPVTLAIHDMGVRIAQRYRFGIYDGTIIAAALDAGCDVLFSEDLQDGQQIDQITIRNPFRNV
jgi:predicted nucleic acid-binding protein